ncbi:hypothetical protein YB2330_002922 [Saitoella coloradoensis]
MSMSESSRRRVRSSPSLAKLSFTPLTNDPPPHSPDSTRKHQRRGTANSRRTTAIYDEFFSAPHTPMSYLDSTASGYFTPDDDLRDLEGEEAWIYQAGAKVTITNMEDRGESWLVTRASSHNLVEMGERAAAAELSPHETEETQVDDEEEEDGRGAWVNEYVSAQDHDVHVVKPTWTGTSWVDRLMGYREKPHPHLSKAKSAPAVLDEEKKGDENDWVVEIACWMLSFVSLDESEALWM